MLSRQRWLQFTLYLREYTFILVSLKHANESFFPDSSFLESVLTPAADLQTGIFFSTEINSVFVWAAS